MKKTILSFLTLVIVNTFSYQALATTNDLFQLPLDQEASYQKLQKTSTSLSVSWNQLNRTPRFISMQMVDSSTSPKDDFEERTLQFINSYKPLFKFKENQNNKFVSISAKMDHYCMNHVVIQ